MLGLLFAATADADAEAKDAKDINFKSALNYINLNNE